MWVSYKSADLIVSYIETTAYKIDAHIHKYYELLWFIAGDAAFIIDSEIHQLCPGEIILTPPDKLHSISFNSPSDYKRFFIQLSPRMLSQIPAGLVKNITGVKRSKIIDHKTADAYKLYDHYTRLAELLKDKTKQSERDKFVASLIAKEFAVAASEAIGKAGQTYNSLENPVIEKLKEYIDTNFSRDITLAEIAKSFYLNKYYICHLFKAETGITINDYIALKRIAASRELKNGDMAIGDIYRRCGFNDYSSFYRAIKKYTGMKPSEFLGNH